MTHNVTACGWTKSRAVSTNPKPTIYRNLYDNTGPDSKFRPSLLVNARYDVYSSTITQVHNTGPYSSNKMHLGFLSVGISLIITLSNNKSRSRPVSFRDIHTDKIRKHEIWSMNLKFTYVWDIVSPWGTTAFVIFLMAIFYKLFHIKAWVTTAQFVVYLFWLLTGMWIILWLKLKYLAHYLVPLG